MQCGYLLFLPLLCCSAPIIIARAFSVLSDLWRPAETSLCIVVRSVERFSCARNDFFHAKKMLLVDSRSLRPHVRRQNKASLPRRAKKKKYALKQKNFVRAKYTAPGGSGRFFRGPPPRIMGYITMHWSSRGSNAHTQPQARVTAV